MSQISQTCGSDFMRNKGGCQIKVRFHEPKIFYQPKNVGRLALAHRCRIGRDQRKQVFLESAQSRRMKAGCATRLNARVCFGTKLPCGSVTKDGRASPKYLL